MRRTVYTSFACKEKITVETTPYKDCEGNRIWTDGKAHYLLRNTGKHACMRSVVWSAAKLADDIISNAEKYGTYID